MLYTGYWHSMSKEKEKIHALDYELLRKEKESFEKTFGPNPRLGRLFSDVETRRYDDNPSLQRFQPLVRRHQSIDYSAGYRPEEPR